MNERQEGILVMIIEIRNQLKGHGFKIVLWITLLAMALLFSPIFFRKQMGVDNAVATINGHAIKILDFERKVAQETERLHFLREQLVGPEVEGLLRSLDPKTLALQALLQDALLNQVAASLKIHISPEFIVSFLQNPSVLARELGDLGGILDDQNQSINMGRLQYYLHRYRLSMSDFDTIIEEKIKRSIVFSIVSSTMYLPTFVLQEKFNRTYLDTWYWVAPFPFEIFLKKAKEQPLSNEEIEAFFEKEHKRYWIPEKRSIKQWEFTPHPYGIVISPAEIEAYYNAQKAKKFIESPIQVQVRRIVIAVDDHADAKQVKEAEELIQKVKQEATAAPGNFEALAKQYSQDKVTAAKGGLVPFFKKGEKDPEFERAAFHLQKDNDISDVVVTNEGFEILQRVARKPVVYKSLASVESTIKADLVNQKFKTVFAEDMTRILNQRGNVAQAIEALAQEKHATERVVSLEKDNSPLAEKAFKLKNKGEWTFLTPGIRGWAIQLQEVEKSHRPELSNVSSAIKTDLYAQKAAALQKEAIEHAKKVAQTEGINALKKLNGITVKSVGPLKHDDREKINELNKDGMPVEEMLSLRNSSEVLSSFDYADTAYLMGIEKVQPFDPELFEAKKNALIKELTEEQFSLVLRGFVASLYRNATLHFMDSLINTRNEDIHEQ